MEPIAHSPEACAFLAGCSLSFINKAIRAGALKSYKRGRRRFVRADDLNAWLSASDVDKAAATPPAAEVA